MSSIFSRAISRGSAGAHRPLTRWLLGAACACALVSPIMAQPVNDNFANATVLVGAVGGTLGSTAGATQEPGEPNHWPLTTTGRSVWYSWVASADGATTFDTVGSSYDTILAIYTGNTVGNLTLIANNDDIGFSLDSRVSFFATAGTTYKIAIDGYNYQDGIGPRSGSFRLNWTSPTNMIVAQPNELQFAATNFTVAENSPGFAIITVTYGGGAAGAVTVDYATADGTAIAGTDYLTVTNTLTFNVGESNKSFTVPILDNPVQNSNKTVLLSLFNPTGGAQLGALSNSVLTILDDETLPVVSTAGEFNFSMPSYVVTDNETVRSPLAPVPASLNIPDRSARGAVVMVTRTGGATGRVFVDVAVGGAFPFTQTLSFDDYQMSATFLVPVPQGGNSIIPLTLLNPRPDPLEDPTFIIPTIGVAQSSIQVLGVNAAAPATFSIERKTYRMDEYDPFDPFNFLGLIGQTNFIDVDVLNPGGQPGSVGIETRANIYGYFVLDGSDYPDAANFVFPQTPYTDGFAGITNFLDFYRFDVRLTFGNNVRRQTIRLFVTNDTTVEFNEDVQLRLHDPDPTHALLNALANVTIMYDDQPAGQADREWDPEFISSTQPPFNTTPGANNIVAAVAVQPDNRTILVGDFTAVNSVSRFRVARMNPDGSLDQTFNPGSGADGFVETVLLYPANALTTTNGGKILVGGGFSAFNNVSRHGLARLNPNGSLDNSFYVGNGADGVVHSTVLQSDGKVVVAGEFTHWDDVPVPGLMRLNVDGSLDTTFNPGLGPNNTIWSVAVRDTAQTIFVPRDAAGTEFEDVNVIETGSVQGNIIIDYDFLSIPDNIRVYYEGVRIFDLTTNGTGQLSIPYGPGTSTAFTIIMNQGVGLPGTVWFYRASVTPVIQERTIYIGGDFTSFDGRTRNGVARLLDNGSLDSSFDPGLGVNNSVYAVAVQPDNKLLVGGSFTRFHTSDRNSLVRLLNDGSLDPNYNVGTGFDDSVFTIILQPDNKALLGGVFQNYNGTRRMGLTRLLVSGSLDTSFMDTAYNQFAGLIKTFSFDPPRYVRSIALQADGNVMIGGSFTNLGGNFSISHGLRNNYTVFTRADKVTRYNIARLIGGYTPGPGNIEFDPAAMPFTVDENAGVFYATMRRVDGRLGTAQITATNFNNTAQSPGDYFGEALLETWPEFAFAAPVSVGFTGLDYFAIPITEDMLQEGDETFGVGAILPEGSITLGGEFIPLGAARGHLDASSVTIADNDFSHGEFNFNSQLYFTNENAGFAVITVVRTNGSSGAVSVDYLTRPGPISPATTNADFTPVRGTLSFAAGQTVRTFNVPIIDDALVEFDETISLILTNATGGASLPGATPTSIAAATLTIIDNDFLQGRLNFRADNFTNNENDTFATIYVTRTGGNVGAMTVQVRTGDGSALSPADYSGVTNTLSWDDGDSSTKSITIPLVTDGLVEGTETVNLFLYNPAINGALGGRTNATLYIEDADHFGAISFSQPLYEVDENGSSPTITLIRNGGIAGTVTVTYATSPITAIPGPGAGADYNDVSGTITFLPGETSHTFVVPILDDLVPDADKSVQLTLSNPVNGTLGALSNATLTIIDNESLNIPAGSLDTGFSSTAQANDAVYALALQPDGRIIMAGDFTLVNSVPHNRIARLKASGAIDSSFDIGPGANDSIRALALQNDGRLLIGGLFTVINSTNRSGIARLASDGSLDAFFNPGAGADNPVYAIALQADDKILVGGSFSTFNGIIRPGIVRLNTNGAVDLNFNVGAGVDGTVYAVALQNDGKIIVGGEFVRFDGVARTNLLRLNANGTLDTSFNPALATDAGVRSIVVQPDGLIVIGGSFTNVAGFSRNRLARLHADGTVDAAFLNGLAGADNTVFAIQQQVDGELVVAGDFKKFNGVTRNAITRLKTDGTTDAAINFGNGANAFVAALLIQPDRRIVLGGGFTTYDDQPRAHIARIYGGSVAGSGSLEYSAPLFIASESGSNALITVRRRFGTEGEARVDAYTLDGSAIAGVDYSAVSNTLIFATGETRQSFLVPLIPNSLPNNDRTVQLRLGNFVNALEGPQPLSVLVIQDDDPTIGFSTANYAVNENAVSGNATITILRSGATNQSLTISIATVPGGTATAGADYVATNALLTFSPGEASKLFNIHVINDTVLEGNETILLALSNSGPGATPGTTLAISNAVLSVIDDEIPHGDFAFLTNNFVVDESAGLANVTIIRTNGSVGIVSVRLSTADLTASAGVDYVPTNIVVTFTDGETNKIVPIGILNDSLPEPDETVLLTLSQPTGGATILTPNATLTIADDEIVPSFVGFQTTNFLVDEAAGFATISVVRTNSRRGTLRVDFSVSNGTATAPADYTLTNGTLNFIDGEDIKTFTIPIVNDTEGEGNETVLLHLTNLVGTNTSLTLPESTLTIVDDDSTLRFSSPTYTVAENAGTALITVLRVGVTNTAVAVTYSTTTGGTATGGLDYTPVTGVLTWPAGDLTPKTFTVPIIDNNILNGDRTVFLLLSNPVGPSAYVTAPTNAVLTITDDESPPGPLAGPVDPTFNGNFGANASVRAVAYDDQSRLYIGGDFTQFHGLAVNRIARLTTNGAVDINFRAGIAPNAGVSDTVYSIAPIANAVYVAGAFTNVSGSTRGRIARLLTDGSVDVTFAVTNGANAAVRGVAITPAQQVIIGGDFTDYEGTPAPRVARLNANGTLDATFVVGGGPNDIVRAVAVQANGQVLIGGDFTSLNGFVVTRLARLNTDGSLDTTFDTGLGADGSINSITVGPDGKILIAGDFLTINGVPRNHVARLNGVDGSVDTSFDIGTGANATIRAVAVELDNHVVVAGDFTTFDGNPFAGVAHLNVDGSLDANFFIGSGADAPVNAIGLVPRTPPPAIAVVTFNSLNTNLTRSTYTENGVTVRGVGSAVFHTVANGAQGTAAQILGSDGVPQEIILGGFTFSLQSIYFTNITGPVTVTSSKGGAALVLSNGLFTFDSSFAGVVSVRVSLSSFFDSATLDNITVISGPDALVPQYFAIGGDFEQFNHVQRGGVAVLTTSGSALPTFDPRNIAARSVFASAIHTNRAQPALVGKVLVGGDFTAIVGVDGVNHLARLNIDGTLDTSFAPGLGPNGTVRAVAAQPDGKVIFGGFFTSYDFIARAYLGRANVDGTLDNTFNFGAGLNNAVLALALQPDGRVIVGGTFTTVYGVSRNSVARLNTNGTVDTTFTVGTGANGAVKAVALQSDGKVLIGGDFTTVNGTSRAHIARLNANGSLDATFVPGTGADAAVNAIAVISTGEILIGGVFTTVNGTFAPRLARLTSTGALDATFVPGTGANDYVSSIALQPDGRLVVGGNFTSFNGQIRNRLVRLNSDGSLDPTINFGAGANDFISTISLQDYDGKIIVGGGFTEFDGLTRVAVARLFGGTNSGTGTFQFSAPAYTVNERGSNAVLLVVRSGGTLGAASVSFSTADGSATSPGDYSTTSGTLNFAEAESVKQILVPIVDNASITGDRTFSVTLFNPSAGTTLGSPATAEVTILDNDSVISFSTAAYSVNENAGIARITVTRTGGAVDAATVDFATGTNGSATAGTDFTPSSGTLTFAPGVRSRSFDVPITDDTLNEFNETVPLLLSNPTGASVLGLANATLTIVENDFAPGVITFGTNSYFVSEDAGSITIEVLRTNGYSGGVTVGYQTLIGSATANVDYVATNGLITFVDGQTNAFITLYLIDDSLTEGNETVPVQLFGPSGGATLGLANAVVTIVDNDAPGTFVFSAPTYSVNEAGGFASITVLRTNGNLGGVSVTVQTSGGTATPTVDYTPIAPTVLNFAAGETARTITIPILQDTLAEGTETVGLLLSNPTGGTSIGVPGTATLFIVDDEASISFAATNFVVTESLTNVVITLVRIGDTNIAASVVVNTSAGSATPGADYIETTTTVSFAPGETNRSFTIPVLDDALAEGDETVNLTLSSPSSGVSLGPIPTATLTIVDDDVAFSFSSATYATNEGTLDLVISVRRSGFTNGIASVDFFTSDGSATVLLDYLSSTGRLVFAAGQTSATFNVRILDDSLVENDETINLTLQNPSAGAQLGPQATAVIIIVDNDTTIGFSTTSYVVSEKVTNAVITLVRNGASSQPVSVGFRTQNGSAQAGPCGTPGADYSFVTNNVVWAAGDVATKSILIPICDDTVLEGAETVQLILSNPVGATLDPAAGTATLTIVDNAGVIAFAAVNSTVVEGTGNALINLVRTGGSNGVVSVQWNVIGGSATPGQDYFGTAGTVVFANGELVKPIILPIADDALVEGIETVNLALSTPSGGASGGGARVGSPSTATLSIIDNDAGIIVGAGTALIAESFLPTNNVIEPGETVTLLFALRNAGLVDAGNVTAGLVYTNGVTNSTPQTQNYGALLAGGDSASRPFTFTALGTNGTRITATLLVTNNGVFLGPVSFDFVLGVQNIPFQNAGVITIPDAGPAMPFPATLTVSGVSGGITKLTVTLHGLTHTYPDDLDIVLVAPNGTAVMLMSDAGGGNALNNATITFDDAAAFVIPDATQITNNMSYRCFNYSPTNDSINPPFAAGTQFSNVSLASLNGSNPNGVWSLYVYDDSTSDSGSINGGWSLNISSTDPVIPGADLSVSVTDAPDPVTLNNFVTYTIGVTNHGPAAASSVMLTNLLPVGATFISVVGPGSYTLNGNVLLGSLGNLPMGAGTTVTVTMQAPGVATLLTFDSTVSAGTADLNTMNNHVSIKTTVNDGTPVPALFAARKNGQIVLSWQSASSNIVLQSASLLSSGSWSDATNAPVVSNGVSTVTAPMSTGVKFYRLHRVP